MFVNKQKAKKLGSFSPAKLASINFFVRIAIVFSGVIFINGVTNFRHIKDDIYFEIIEPEILHYTFRARPAQDFGVPFEIDKLLRSMPYSLAISHFLFIPFCSSLITGT
ncbi:hypothetical protein CEXT_467501 [Caerostris extrusa]|uniref:Mannosyltransferase n=1 Tax=Caerostris extrusa TaxID=172846 RepID=A0AAV4WW47_CAEEX|nr:hypothetical protein CEXT_467501 [Caerostris extrusa]